MSEFQKRNVVVDCVTRPRRVDAALAQKWGVSLEVLVDLGISDEQIARYVAAFAWDMSQHRALFGDDRPPKQRH